MAQSLTAAPAPDSMPLAGAASGNRPQQNQAGNALPHCPAGPFAPGSRHFIRYLQSRFAGAAEERFHATYCDGRGYYLDDEVLVCGSPGSVAARGRALFGRALALGARGLLLAHNHPSGRCRPSDDDLSATNRMREIAAALDIVVLDHLILTQNEVYSMRLGGCL